MKIRTGFVSNSSSSSFCVFGIESYKCDLIEIMKEKTSVELIDFSNGDKSKTFEQLLDDEDIDYSHIQKFFNSKGLFCQFSFEDNIFLIGRSYATLGDDETGLQFKKDVENKITSLFNIGAPPKYICTELMS